MDEFIPTFTTQGTRLSDRPPWMSYADSLDIKADSALQSEIDEYSKHRHAKTGSETEEALCREKEANDVLSQQYAWLPALEYENEECRVGRVLDHAEFITLLRSRCGLRCYYTQHPQPRKITLLVLWNGQLEVGCWAQWGKMPEYSMCRFDEHGIILDEKFRGYRTCLLQLILKGFLSEEVVNKVFGPAIGPASTRYNSTLYNFRNREVEVV
jgi:hypothetical protein